jgi:KipI family sensor histidine kinase inhibitor
MRLVPFGDIAASVVPEAGEDRTPQRGQAVAAAIEAACIPGVLDVVAAPERVAVGFDPRRIPDLAAVGAAVIAAAERHMAAESEHLPATHVIPVAFDGADLEEVCGIHGLARRDLVAIHTGPSYTVEAVGFLPGFGYLHGLDDRLVTPRRATPRAIVPAGSVGIGGAQTGVYPFASPGGWNLIGRSGVELFDANRPRPAVFAVGDRVRFVEAEPADVPAPVADGRTTHRGGPPVDRSAAITVIQPGLFTTVQDLGRPGYRASGVPRSGAVDQVSLELANALVGNPPDAAAIECTLLGPTLRFDKAAVVALVGAGFPGLPAGRPVRVPAGTVIELGHATAGCRGYLAVAGGIAVEPVLGSRSTFVPAGLGGLSGRAFRAGDSLAVDDPIGAPLAEALPPALDSVRRPRVLRVLPGEHAGDFDESVWARMFRTSSRSNRMGVRLEGDSLRGVPADGSRPPLAAAGAMRSVPVFPGTVQVPPDGCPIILLADAQTIGGYPVFGHVITADLPIVAQLRPGDEVCWRPVSLGDAVAALRELQSALAACAEGPGR